VNVVPPLASVNHFNVGQNVSIEYKVNTLKNKENMVCSKVIRCMNVAWTENYMMTVIGFLNQKKFYVTDTLRNIELEHKDYVAFVEHQRLSVVVNACRFNLADKVVGYRSLL
jgi:hypothetical protein